MQEALQIISEEHRNLWRIAITIDSVAGEMEAGETVDTAFFNVVFDYIEEFMDGCHHAKEDDYLFPALLRRDAKAAVVIDRLQAEHRNGPEVLSGLRRQLAECAALPARRGDFAAALRTYTQALKSHIRTEEQEALPMARAALTSEDWADIDRAFLDNADPMFGEKARAEFRELFHRIAALAPVSVGLGGGTAGNLMADPTVRPADAPADAGVLLRARGVESSYGRIKALKGIDLEVRRGELVALVGANGAGKTTFLRVLSGVQSLDSGNIVFDGDEIGRLRADLRMRRGVCQVPEGRQVFGPLAIEDNLRLGAYTRPKGEVADGLERVFGMFPILKEKRALPAGTLSGGQQQMLAIGRALMGKPKLLLLDEPSMGLAPLLVEEVFNVVKSLKEQGMTILLVEQNAFAALAIADRAYVLETGTVTLSGTGQELLKNEQVRAAYLGM